MFDWNDEELSNIIWGEEGESQDHIVPYADAKEENNPLGYGDYTKKELNLEILTTKSTEQKETASLIDLGAVKQECSPKYDKSKGLPATEFSIDSWPDQESLGTEMPDKMSKISRHDANIDEKAALLDNTSEIFQSQPEDSEPGDFVDYSWASVGSFEDLDRIFSNEDALFGHGSLGNPDELWSPSKDVMSSPERSIPPSGDSPSLAFSTLKRSAEQFEGYLSDQNQSFTPGYENLNTLASDTALDVKSCPANIKYPATNGNLLSKQKTALNPGGSNPSYSFELDTGKVSVANEYMDKENRQKKLVKGRKKLEVKSETGHLPNVQTWTQTGNRFLQFDSPYVANVGQARSSLGLGQQGQLQVTESAQYKQFSNPPLLSFVPGNVMKHYTSKPTVSHFHSGEVSKQPTFSGYEVPPGTLNPLDQSPKAPMKSSIMTPREKIEKLRRRQQMRAMLAIQKQQQQFSNQVSSTEYSVAEGEHNDTAENLSVFPLLDPNSPVEQDDSNTICTAHDDCPVQDSILYELQDIVGKLDLKVRLCIRDSLYRLAQSASQRQYGSGTSSSNKGGRDDIARKEEINSQNRFPKTPEAETETNPIDRTVAHLLFHKRLECSGKLVETPDSTLSTKPKASGPMNLLTKSLSQRSENKQEPELPCLYAKQDQLETRASYEASEIATTSQGADNGNKAVEDSLLLTSC